MLRGLLYQIVASRSVMAYKATINYHGKLIANGQVRTDQVRQAMQRSATYGETLVRTLTPKRTGRLQAGWSVRVVGSGLLWKNPTPYAGFVEIGTRRMNGRRMLEKAERATRKYFQQQLSRSMGVNVTLAALEKTPDYANIRKGTSGVGFGG